MSLALAGTNNSSGNGRRRGPPAPLNLVQAGASNVVASAVVNADDGPQRSTNPGFTTESRPRSLRNMKKLSLDISSANSSQAPSPASPKSKVSLASIRPAHSKRPSVTSLPGASAGTIMFNTTESEAASAPYLDGPIQIMPNIWLGSEDNARDWPTLVTRNIKSILNVAKEVAIPFDQPISHSGPAFLPADLSSGRPPLHYLKLSWSHGQSDLVNIGFVEGMRFVDDALSRQEGVLVHCQMGVSRSATMVIALVMRAAEYGGPGVPEEITRLRGKGMQAAYDYVKSKSKWVGPNMALFCQLIEYQRSLRGGSPTESLSGASDEEWERQRKLLDSQEREEQENEADEVMREAKQLDKEMEERRARKTSLSSAASSTASFTGAVGNGAPWRSRYGSNTGSGFSRTRAGSMESNYTSRSSISYISEDLVEEEEEEESDTGFAFDRKESSSGKQLTPSTDATDEDAHEGTVQVLTLPKHQPKVPVLSAVPRKMASAVGRVPPSASPMKTSFSISSLQVPPSAPAAKKSFKLTPSLAAPPPSAPYGKQSFGLSMPPTKEKNRPAPLIGFPSLKPNVQVESVASPSFTGSSRPSVSSLTSMSSSVSSSNASLLSVPASNASKSSRRKSFKSPPPLLIPFPSREGPQGPKTASAVSLSSGVTPSASQTLFVFPPSPTGAKTPSTLMLTTTPLLTPTFAAGGMTPRQGSFVRQRTDRTGTTGGDKKEKRRSWLRIGSLGVGPVTPTTATVRVDAKGWVGVEAAGDAPATATEA